LQLGIGRGLLVAQFAQRAVGVRDRFFRLGQLVGASSFSLSVRLMSFFSA
jgi:hypothetical protein